MFVLIKRLKPLAAEAGCFIPPLKRAGFHA